MFLSVQDASIMFELPIQVIRQTLQTQLPMAMT